MVEDERGNDCGIVLIEKVVHGGVRNGLCLKNSFCVYK